MPLSSSVMLSAALGSALFANAATASTIPQSDSPSPMSGTTQVGGATAAPSDEATPLMPPIIDVPPNTRHARWYGRAGLGFAYRWGFDQSMLGAALDGELGAQNHRLAGGVRLHLEAGRILAGLAYQVVTFGPMMWLFAAPRLRVGAGIDAGALLINRRTQPGHSMWSVTLGGHLEGSFDLLKLGQTGALHFDTSVGAYALTLAPGPVSILTTFGLGYRP